MAPPYVCPVITNNIRNLSNYFNYGVLLPLRQEQPSSTKVGDEVRRGEALKQLIMIQQPLRNTTTYYPALLVVKGKQEYEQQVNRLSRMAWQIAYTALWNAEEFSALEKEKALEFITGFIREQRNPEKAYSVFVQRVLLARQYIITHPGSYAPIPTQWFSPANKNGFAGTQRWYESVELSRQSLPKYKQSIKAFAEAVLETVQSDDARDFHYWRNYFSEQDAQATLNLFLSTLANCRYL